VKPPPDPLATNAAPARPAPVAVTPKPPLITSPSGLDLTTAQKVITTWQQAKQLALGKTHDTSQLATALSPSQTEQWTKRAQAMARAKSYWQYDLKEVRVLKVEPQAGGIATVQIQEQAQFFEGAKLNRARSYQKRYTVRYGLVRNGTSWVIADIVL
uniref:ARC6/PARC6 family protein n=1 Tax=Candidatus Cyanaurora vandensis TaxID=2714958 RepID=UPI00257A757B